MHVICTVTVATHSIKAPAKVHKAQLTLPFTCTTHIVYCSRDKIVMLHCDGQKCGVRRNAPATTRLSIYLSLGYSVRQWINGLKHAHTSINVQWSDTIFQDELCGSDPPLHRHSPSLCLFVFVSICWLFTLCLLYMQDFSDRRVCIGEVLTL